MLIKLVDNRKSFFELNNPKEKVFIKNVLFSRGVSGYFNDNQNLIKIAGLNYANVNLRQAGESLSIIIVLSDGQTAYGDCVSVQYGGVNGRDKNFCAEKWLPFLKSGLSNFLKNKNVADFLRLSKEVDCFFNAQNVEICPAIGYGLSQALLDASAKANKCLMAEVIAKEYGINSAEIIKNIDGLKFLAQCGDNRYENADKMIIKRIDVLPHGLINNIQSKLGYDGEKLLEYAAWLKNRILELRRDNNFNPAIHFDVYGLIGEIFNNDENKIISYLIKLKKAVEPFDLNIEDPVAERSKPEQIDKLHKLKNIIDNNRLNIKIIADEWCNTLEDVKEFADNGAAHMIQIKTPDLGSINDSIEAVLYCKQKNVLSYLGGSCNETNKSAEVCMHIAAALKPDLVMIKPGMDVDSGYMICKNELQRIKALV